MRAVAQGSLGKNLKLVWMSAPHTRVVVPVTAIAANRARSGKGTRFHINKASVSSCGLLTVVKGAE